MYRVFCESYQNFLNLFDEDCYRKKIAEPFELIVDINRYEDEKNQKSEKYKRLSDLIIYMKNNIDQFPKLKAFLWTLESRNMNGKKYNIANKEELNEQIQLVNSFLKLAYWK